MAFSWLRLRPQLCLGGAPAHLLFLVYCPGDQPTANRQSSVCAKLHVTEHSVWLQVFKMKIRGYIPDFKLAFEHFCIHTGGRGVIEEIEKQLQLAPESVQPSKDTLFRYGNTSSSSIWSVLALSFWQTP